MRKKDYVYDDINANTVKPDFEIDNGTLVFDSKESFNLLYNEALQKDEEDLAIETEKNLYSKNFYSLMPVFTEENESNILEGHLSNLRKNGVESPTSKGSLYGKDDYENNMEFLEFLFGEEVFASFLDQKGEIIIGDEVYKYTDVGLFIFNKDDKTKLYKYLDKKGISENFSTKSSTKEAFINQILGTSRCGRNYYKSSSESNRDFTLIPK